MPSHYVVFIAGVPVHVRMLPSGDWSVWHPYNERLRTLVEPICRPRGYWSSEYNNWIVRREVASRVIATLEKIGRGYA